MHLSMLSPREREGGTLTVRSVPRVGILILRHIPRVGNLTWPPSWIMTEEGLESYLVSKAFPSPGSGEKALGTRLPKNNSAILENTQKAFK